MVRLPPRLRPLFPYLKPAYTAVTGAIAPASIAASNRLTRGNGLPTGWIATTEQAAESTGGRWLLSGPEHVIARPPYPDGPAPEAFVDQIAELAPRTVVAELPRGRVLGSARAVVSGRGDLVQDLSYYFGTDRARPRQHPIFVHPFPPPPLAVPGRLGLLATRGDANYYHFLMDVLPRLGVAARCPEIEAPTQWYVPQTLPFQRELLDLAGLPVDQRLDADRHPHVRAETLVVPSPPSLTVVNPPWVVTQLRAMLLPEPPPVVPGRFVYVTRAAGQHNRAVVNEDEVLRRLGARGFRSVDPATLTVAEQITTFAQAQVVVAVHGAALANLTFSGPGCTVVELFPHGAVVPDYWKLSTGVPGLGYRYLTGRGSGRVRDRSRMLVSDVDVDVDALERLLDGLSGPVH